MKVISLIPKKVRQTYQITKHDNSVSISNPAFINIRFDESFKIINGKITLDIKNDKCIVFLWKDLKIMSITIY